MKLAGKTARDICATLGIKDPSGGRPGWKATKNFFGDLLEHYFLLDPAKHSESHPDFVEAELELKLLPLKRGRGTLRVKEPTSISMIDYVHLRDETWSTAMVRPKLLHILFVFQVMEPEDLMASWYREVQVFEASDLDRALFEADWTKTHQWVLEGRAHELSESQSIVLAARRKGKGGPTEKMRRQPVTTFRADAPSRAWALKCSFTQQILDAKVLQHNFEAAFPHLADQIVHKGLNPIENQVRALLAADEGRTLEEIAVEAGIPIARGKGLAARIMKRRLSIQDLRADILEFEKLGISVKTLHLRERDGWPFEAVSFPAVNLRELAVEDFEGIEDEEGAPVKERSELADQLERIFFITTHSPGREDPQEKRRLGKTFFWSATPEQWRIIRKEWEMFRDEVAEGRAAYDRPCTELGRSNSLTHSSDTKLIHMRPHARVACDEDTDPRENKVTRQSFWLNQAFIYSLIQEYDALPPGANPKN
ncbi:MAG TPA: MutH/Sau3AI family endonuclease [Thermoplasmata archaeon]|nr:MutH/Sau3AI family endonuclease [Thermoplasmata archaeon]